MNRRVAILGAGPYGLAVAAHLRGAGLNPRVFGRPMEFWQRKMPRGMFLRSAWEASNIGDPGGRLTLDAYRAERAPTLAAPIPIAAFLEYAEWFRERAVPNIDERRIVRIDQANGGFRLALDDGEELAVRRVVVAAGLAPFAYRPSEFDHVPPSLASHSSEHTNFDEFAAKRVLVTGAGQSALESAALLREAGAEVEVHVRASVVHWLPGQRLAAGRLAPARRHLYRPFVDRMLHAPTDVGPPGLNWLVAAPRLFRAFPRSLQDPIARRCIRPAGAAWLPARLEGVPILQRLSTVSADPHGDCLSVKLSDGSERVVDHALLATGFRIDVSRYPFLSGELVRQVATAGGFPMLRPGFESSVDGLHFVGAPSAWSFGPIMRFVCGTWFTGRELARVVLSLTAGGGRRPGLRSRRALSADVLDPA